MPNNKFVKSRIWMVVLIIIIASISAGLLTAVNIWTKQKIALNAELKLKSSVLNVFDVPYEKKEIIAIFNQRIEVRKLNGRTFYQYFEQDKISGLAFEMKGAGFWGPIHSLVALEPDLETLKGIEILHQEETPGLGGRITEDEFKSQFKGKPVGLEISIDAITGATMTSKAFKKIINENVKFFREEFKKRQKKES